MKDKFIVYLAGPISGCTFDECVDWREQFNNMLPKEIIGMSPMRGKSYLNDKSIIHCSYPNHALSCSRGIITRDYNDCRRADMIVVNFLGTTEKVSIGTVMEIAWGKAFNKPVVCVMEDDNNVHDHPMIQECIGFRVKTLEEAATIVKAVLLPVPHRT